MAPNTTLSSGGHRGDLISVEQHDRTDLGRPGHGRAECPLEVVWIEDPVALGAEPVSRQVREKAKLREQAEGTRPHVQSARMGKDSAVVRGHKGQVVRQKLQSATEQAQDEGSLAVAALPGDEDRPTVDRDRARVDGANASPVESRDRPGDDGAEQAKRLVMALPASGLASALVIVVVPSAVRVRATSTVGPAPSGRSASTSNQLYVSRTRERMASSFERTTTSTPWIRYRPAVLA